MNAGDVLDCIIKANYIFLRWLAIVAVIAAIGFFVVMFSVADVAAVGIPESLPPWVFFL